MILRIIFFTLLSIGLTFIALDIFKIPYLKTSRAVKGLLKKRRKKESGRRAVAIGSVGKACKGYTYKRIQKDNTC